MKKEVGGEAAKKSKEIAQVFCATVGKLFLSFLTRHPCLNRFGGLSAYALYNKDTTKLYNYQKRCATD